MRALHPSVYCRRKRLARMHTYRRPRSVSVMKGRSPVKSSKGVFCEMDTDCDGSRCAHAHAPSPRPHKAVSDVHRTHSSSLRQPTRACAKRVCAGTRPSATPAVRCAARRASSAVSTAASRFCGCTCTTTMTAADHAGTSVGCVRTHDGLGRRSVLQGPSPGSVVRTRTRRQWPVPWTRS